MRRSLIVLGLVSSLLAACSSTPTAPAPAPAPAAAPAPSAPAPSTSASTAPAAPPGPSVAAHLDPNSELRREASVYFAFDQSLIEPQYTPIIERHGQYLLRNGALKVVVEGHCDERGSAEYNLALGQRRAEAVSKALRVYGVKDAQVEAVSFGRERPKALGHDEESWRQNRRADIAYR